MSETIYTPGVCNINPKEVAYRKKAFYLGVAIGVPLFIVLAVLRAAPLWGLIIFVPTWIGAIGYVQAKNKFCVGYAASGVYNASDEYADVAKVAEEKARKLDKAKARKLNAQAVAIGAVSALVGCGVLALLHN